MSRLPTTLVAMAGAAIVALVLAPAASAQNQSKRMKDPTPVIFVHGGSGSGAQFQSQQLRLTSNGFPMRRIFVVEYDTLAPLEQTLDQVHRRLDRTIERAKARSGKPAVDMLGHSRGTRVMHAYLEDPGRAANVRRYVNIDGASADAPPGGVPTLAIWAGRRAAPPGAQPPERRIVGAWNVTISNQTHVEVATSRRAFHAIFRFLFRRQPRTTRIERGGRPQRQGGNVRVRVAGRALIFPQNVAVPEETQLEVWRVRQRTGERIGRRPLSRQVVRPNGWWRPVRVLRGQRYEFALRQEGGETTHHFYMEPFLRNDKLVRLLTSLPGQGIGALVPMHEESTSLLAVRYKELWGDAGNESDQLRVNGVNVLNPATSPVSNRTIAVFVADFDGDGQSSPAEPNPLLFGLPFLTGVDVFVPAASPPNATVQVGLVSRGRGTARRLNFPNFPSSTDVVTLYFNDHEQR